MFPLLCPWARQVIQNVPTDTGSLCYKVAVLRNTINDTAYYYVCEFVKIAVHRVITLVEQRTVYGRQKISYREKVWVIDIQMEVLHTYVHTYIYTHIHTYIHTYTHKPTYLLTRWNRVQLEKLTSCLPIKKFPAFCELKGSLPHLQLPATSPYPEPARSSPCPQIPLPEDPS